MSVAGLIGKLGALLGSQTLAGTLSRTALTGLGSLTATELISAITGDKASGDPVAVAQTKRIPQYAIVDLHNNKIVRTLSTRHVYAILTHPRRKGGRGRRPKVEVLHAGDQLVTVR